MENNSIPVNVEEDSDDEYFNSIAPGFRFRPTDEELIVEYLMPKINNQELPRNRINIVKLYDCSPDDLVASGRYKSSNTNEWYFFTPRNKKYKGGSRPNRAAGDGFWKATETLRNIVRNGELIGYRKTLVYHSGKPPNGIKTDWIMHEFTVKNPPAPLQTTENSMRLDDWVLCRLHKKFITSSDRNTNEEADNNVEQVVGDEIQNITLANSIVALEEPLTHNESMAQNIYTYWQPQPLSELPSMISFDLGESFFFDGIPSTPLNDQVGMIIGSNNNFGVPSDLAPLMFPRPQECIPKNGFSTGGFSQYSLNQMSMLIGERTQQNGTHEILRSNGSSTNNTGDCSQCQVNPMPMLISGRSQHHEIHETLRVNASWTHDIGGYPQFLENNVPMSILNDQLRVDEISRHNMNHMRTWIPSGYHDEIPKTLRVDSSATHEIGGSYQYMMNHNQIEISNYCRDEIHNTLRANNSSAHNIEGCSQPMKNQSSTVISNGQHDELLGILRANCYSTSNIRRIPSLSDESYGDIDFQNGGSS